MCDICNLVFKQRSRGEKIMEEAVHGRGGMYYTWSSNGSFIRR